MSFQSSLRPLIIVIYLIGSLIPIIPSLAWAKTNHLLVDVKINGHPVKVAFDTGADSFYLFRRTVHQLKLKINKNNTTQFQLNVFDSKIPVHANILDIPNGMKTEIAGIIGWQALTGLVKINWKTATVDFLSEIPNTKGWQKHRYLPNTKVLVLDIKNPNLNYKILLDTGADGHIALKSNVWKSWLQKTNQKPITISAGFSPAAGGFYVSNQVFAPLFKLGLFNFNNQLIEENKFISELTKEYTHVIGVEAMKQYDWVLDYANKTVYFKKRVLPTTPIAHNMLGAVFIPKDTDSTALIGHVVPLSLADKLGIKNNDELVEINGLNATKWKEDPRIMPLHHFWKGKKGNTLNLAIKRGDRLIKIKAQLTDLINPKQ